MLDAFVEREAQGRFGRMEFGDVPSQLAKPVQEVVEHHESQSDWNGEQVKQANIPQPGVPGCCGGNHMDGSQGECLSGVGMAFTAGGSKVGFRSRGAGVA